MFTKHATCLDSGCHLDGQTRAIFADLDHVLPKRYPEFRVHGRGHYALVCRWRMNKPNCRPQCSWEIVDLDDVAAGPVESRSGRLRKTVFERAA